MYSVARVVNTRGKTLLRAVNRHYTTHPNTTTTQSPFSDKSETRSLKVYHTPQKMDGDSSIFILEAFLLSSSFFSFPRAFSFLSL